MSDPAFNLRAAMPAHVQKQWAEQDAAKAKLAEELRRACADAIERLACAIHSPNISRIDLEEASRKVTTALVLSINLEAL